LALAIFPPFFKNVPSSSLFPFQSLLFSPRFSLVLLTVSHSGFPSFLPRPLFHHFQLATTAAAAAKASGQSVCGGSQSQPSSSSQGSQGHFVDVDNMGGRLTEGRIAALLTAAHGFESPTPAELANAKINFPRAFRPSLFPHIAMFLGIIPSLNTFLLFLDSDLNPISQSVGCRIPIPSSLCF
jgi:hypothetical protein